MKNVIQTIERKVLFTATRVLSLCLIICIGVLIYFAFNLMRSIEKEKTTIVKLNDVVKTIPATKQIVTNVALPTQVKYYLGEGKNREILNNWLSDMSVDEINDFLNNLESIISEASYRNKTSQEITEIINSYKDVKKAKMTEGIWEEPFRKIQKGAILMLISLGVGMIILCTLILVLLAIERNTRLTIKQQ